MVNLEIVSPLEISPIMELLINSSNVIFGPDGTVDQISGSMVDFFFLIQILDGKLLG